MEPDQEKNNEVVFGLALRCLQSAVGDFSFSGEGMIFASCISQLPPSRLFILFVSKKIARLMFYQKILVLKNIFYFLFTYLSYSIFNFNTLTPVSLSTSANDGIRNSVLFTRRILVGTNLFFREMGSANTVRDSITPFLLTRA